MKKTGNENLSFSLRGYILMAVAVWTLTLAGSLAWNLHIEDRHLRALAIDKARTHIQKDMAFRSWSARHGGVYVPIDERTPPNPLLAHLPERDITTASGKDLTLMNPAYMMRQFNEESATGLVSGHITSLKVLRPQNAPDEWEGKALKAFEKGRKEVIETSQIDGRPYLRMMLPLFIEKGCLKCHGHQGYRVGDIRGGISTSVFLAPYQAMAGQARQALLLSHGLLWLLGMGGIGLAGRQSSRRLTDRKRWLDHLNRCLKMLSECNQALVHSDRERTLLAKVCGSIVKTGGYRMVWVGYAQQGQKNRLVPVAQAGSGKNDPVKPDLASTDTERAQGHIGTALRTGRPCVARNIRPAAHSFPWQQAATRPATQSSVAIPLSANGRCLGAIVIYAAEHDAFAAEEMKLLEELTDDLTFGIMTLRTRARHRRAEEKIRNLAKFPSENPNPVLRLNRQGSILYANPVARQWLRDWDGEVPPEWRKQVGEALANTAPMRREEKIGRRFYSVCLAPYPEGHYVNLYGIDITERVEAEEKIGGLNADLEERVRQRTAQLEAANRELEAFAYSVSHDLRAPLRAIDGFSQALLEDYHQAVDPQGQDYLRRVRAATERMGRLIDDILQLSHISRHQLQTEKVDLSALAGEALKDLLQIDPQRRVNCLIEEGLTAVGDSHLLRVVLDNLLGNAMKFTARKTEARIEFGVTGDRSERNFFVRDNGAGFDMAYADKLFLTFHRLHTAEEFPGTGIGLTLVQRVIDHHGGRVWAEGEVERGATFFFTLQPDSPEEKS